MTPIFRSAIAVRWSPRLAGLIVVLCVTAAMPSGAGASSALRVIPFPGTPDAAPSSAVIFSALSPPQLRSVRVTGSRSGEHAGHLELLPAGAGTAFVPRRPFAPGETVSVAARLSLTRAGAAEGVPDSSRLSYSFAVAPRVGPAAIYAARSHARRSPSAGGAGPTAHFRSEPDLRPAAVSVSADPDHGSGDIFVAPVNSPQVGPMILNARGQLVWSHPVTSTEATNFAVQHYQGQPVLTWWQGSVPAPGEDVIMNSSYRTVAVVHAGDGYQAELHEFQITPRGTAFITCFAPAYTNLTSVGGPGVGGVIDGVIQEVDIKTGKVLWEWHALGHVPVDASYTRYSKSSFYDFFHLNSIQQLPDGNLLISARNTWAVYEISRRTGKILWTLGGKSSDFRMGRGTNFEWQHDARLSAHTLSLLDDAADPPEERESSAKYLKVNPQAMTVSLIKRYTHDPPVLSAASGSVQTLPNQNVLVGWGAQPQFSEYTPSGRQIFNASFAFGVWSYRAYRFHWVGRPRTPPSLAAVPSSDGHVKLYASWNGATQVRAWRVLGGSSPTDLRPMGLTAPRSNFETALRSSSQPPYFAVQAVDGQGGTLGTSAPLADPPHLALYGSSVFVPASGGLATVPVGCLSRKPCQVRVTLSAGGRILARSHPQAVRADRGALIPIRVQAPAPGRMMQIALSAGSGLRASRRMGLVTYSATQPAHPATLPDAPGVQVASATDFVSSAGMARILTACYASVPCRIQETLLIAGRAVGHSTGTLGAGELGYVGLPLDRAGRAMLSRAAGNRRPATVRLSVRGRRRSTHVDLVRYG